MNIRTVRNELGAGATATGLVHGYPRPPGQVAKFPALIVRDPTSVQYHRHAGESPSIDLPVFVVVSRTAAQDGTDTLDDLVSYDNLPTGLEQIAGASWRQLVVVDLAGGYLDFVQAGQTVGLGAVLNLRFTFT